MRKLLFNFKFKWWSWEIDTLKLLPFAFLVLAFLPILPYEKKDGKLTAVLGFEAVEDNFYTLHFNDEIMETVSSEMRDAERQKKYLLDQGYSKEIAGCLVVRDLFLDNYFYENELKIGFHKWTSSPVPAIFLARVLFKDYVERQVPPSSSYKSFEKLIKKCKKFGDIVPPPGYLDNEFKYEKNNN